MIEYKVRAKHFGEWVEGYFCVYRGLPQILLDELSWESIDDIKTLGRYTGLCDKNGNKIWEGDIVIFNRGRNLPNTKPRPLKIFFDESNAQFTCYESPYATLQKDQMSECEVIGNIYDNPELLEVKE